MILLTDYRWRELKGGYKIPYDASAVLRRMEAGEAVWEELWSELHHQGDVGEASYAAVPHLARIAEVLGTDWNFYAIVSIIEIERHRTSNPPIPGWNEAAYHQAWKTIGSLALGDLRFADDSLLFRSAMTALALSKGKLKLGSVLMELDESEIDDYLEKHKAWNSLYQE